MKIMKPVNSNTCPLCRRAMRAWAFDARKAVNEEMHALCIRTAKRWRDECLCTAKDHFEHYEALTARLVAVMRNKELHLTPTQLFEASAGIRREIEQVKERFGGYTPKLKEAA